MEPGAIEVARDRLYYICVRTVPHDTSSSHFFTVDDSLHYWPFFLDFGPLSLGNLYRFSQLLNAKLLDKSLASKRIYLYSGPQMNKRANAVYLLAAYTLLYHGRTPEEAWRPFAGISPPLAPWHDASPTVDTFHLSVLDVLRGINKARECRFFSFDRDYFDVEEYEHYERVENGDMNWLAHGRFLAFAGPHDARTTTAEGYHTTAVDDVIPYFKAKGVTAVVRLNKKYYNEKRFLAAGIDHHDMYYLDGSNPPEPILQRFLATCEQTPGAIAVHCKAGLGRTGTCIGAYCMKHYRFTAREIIGWMRVCRPGSVIGPQQHFMEEIQPRMWEEGEAFRRIKRIPMPVPSSLLGQHQAAAMAAASSSSSGGSGLGVSRVGGGGGGGSNTSSPTAAGTGGGQRGAGAMPASPSGAYGSPGATSSGSSSKPRLQTTTSPSGGGPSSPTSSSAYNYGGAPSPVAVGMPGSPTRMAGSGMSMPSTSAAASSSGSGSTSARGAASSPGQAAEMFSNLSIATNGGGSGSGSSGLRSTSRNGGSRGASGSPLMRARAPSGTGSGSGGSGAAASSGGGAVGNWSLNGGAGRTGSNDGPSTPGGSRSSATGGGGSGGYASPGSSPIATSVLTRARSRGATGGAEAGASSSSSSATAGYYTGSTPVAVPATKATAPAVGSYGGFSSPAAAGAPMVHPSAAFRTPDGVYAQGDMLRSAKSRSPQVMGALSPPPGSGAAGFVMPGSPLGNARYGGVGAAGGGVGGATVLSPSGMMAGQSSLGSSVRSPVGFAAATSPGLVPIASSSSGAPAASPGRYQIRR